MTRQYTVRVHPRARHVRLRLDPRDGLVVTVPPRFDQCRIPALLVERRAWIEAVSKRQRSVRAECAADLLGSRPQRVELPAIGRTWAVDYRFQGTGQARLSEAEGQLVISLPSSVMPGPDAIVAGLLRRWLSSQARRVLGDELAALARCHGLHYSVLGIRHQRSRWGSCSSAGRISLNARLMFCPPETMRYVLLHELVHTEHPNHSAAFWARVAALMPDYETARLELTRVWQRLPEWA